MILRSVPDIKFSNSISTISCVYWLSYQYGSVVNWIGYRELNWTLISIHLNGPPFMKKSKTKISKFQENVWCIGKSIEVGSDTCSLHSLVDVPCPHIVGNRWNYWNGFTFVNSDNNVLLTCQAGNYIFGHSVIILFCIMFWGIINKKQTSD